MIGLVVGGLLIDMGLRPGSFRRFMDGIRDFHLWNREGLPIVPQTRATGAEEESPVWLAIAGAALIALTIVGLIIDFY